MPKSRGCGGGRGRTDGRRVFEDQASFRHRYRRRPRRRGAWGVSPSATVPTARHSTARRCGITFNRQYPISASILESDVVSWLLPIGRLGERARESEWERETLLERESERESFKGGEFESELCVFRMYDRSNKVAVSVSTCFCFEIKLVRRKHDAYHRRLLHCSLTRYSYRRLLHCSMDCDSI